MLTIILMDMMHAVHVMHVMHCDAWLGRIRSQVASTPRPAAAEVA